MLTLTDRADAVQQPRVCQVDQTGKGFIAHSDYNLSSRGVDLQFTIPYLPATSHFRDRGPFHFLAEHLQPAGLSIRTGTYRTYGNPRN